MGEECPDVCSVEVEKLPSPGHLGPFATSVLWAITVDGNANNLGAIVLQNLAKSVRGKSFNVPGLKERIDFATLSPQTRDEKQ
jgi:hypothetical protein